ncbi:MAG: hypothetical protein JJU42_14590 [Rhodobacteraceae bacterium]|nr:hypothetical protein [Paracoccaceae bacterium]
MNISRILHDIWRQVFARRIRSSVYSKMARGERKVSDSIRNTMTGSNRGSGNDDK